MADARERGAKFLYGDGTLDSDIIFRPTIIECKHEARVVVEETFYSVLPLVTFEEETEIRQYITETKYGLNACVYGDCSPAFKSFLWMMHKAVCIDSITTSQKNWDMLKLVGGFKNSGFIGEWFTETTEGSALRLEPLLNMENLLQPIADRPEKLWNARYVFRKGRFNLERELSWQPAT